MECEYCSSVIKTYGALKKHQNTAKYCLAKQNKTSIIDYQILTGGSMVLTIINEHSISYKWLGSKETISKREIQLLNENKNKKRIKNKKGKKREKKISLKSSSVSICCYK